MTGKEIENRQFESSAEMSPSAILQQLITIFTGKGWMDKSIRIKHRENNYRISCNENGFIAYRINDNHGISPGIPGWVVCSIDSDQIIEDSEFSSLASDEPGAREWLRCIAGDDFEVTAGL
jgi:hypothetical protein